MQSIHPSKIIVNKDYPRFRKDMGDIHNLASSIQKLGQLQPIVVTNDYHLVAGGRRLAACLLLKCDIKYIFFGELSSIERRMIELEENIHRKDFTPAEEVLAIEELHKLKQKEHGETIHGKSGGWKLEDTAKLIGKSAQTISRDLETAQAVRENPILKEAKTKQEIKSSIRGRKKLIDKALELSKRKNDPIMKEVDQIVHTQDWYTFIKNIPKETIDIILTDPPYGMDVNKQTMGNVGQTGFKFKDDLEYAKDIYSKLAIESYRVSSELAHAIVFCSGQLLHHALTEFESAGWNVWSRPLVWIKKDTGQSNNPDLWPASCSEFAIFARRKKASLENYPMPDWVQVPPLLGEKRTHPTEKPLKLMKWILNHVAFEKAKLIDPFAGSYSSIQAAIDLGLNAKGCDISSECEVLGKVRIAKALEKRAKQ